ncbi:hypothetical protein M7I_1690 [Glarea lozoyensis 74030]|uniref:Gylcosyl hydrolase 115 C-terminal domain-containing protein n=1 Tax=Glarea lozoyensis (strain ATCC 74030 / MF5533) TaxID=1104152 RepID=H0EGS1_GLAL7|nr:hypothetical protein M7I_1690 [Glarea lozoyensis 74030]
MMSERNGHDQSRLIVVAIGWLRDQWTDSGKNLTLGNWVSSNSTNSTSSKRGNVERAEDAAPKGWQDVPESGPQNGPQSVTRATAAGSQTTVYYWYNPVTSFINYTLAQTASNFTGPTLLNNAPNKKTVIIVGTVDKSTLITQLGNSGKIDLSELKNCWECFISQVVENPLPGVAKALVIAGADTRGTIYGLYDISEQIGVSPWNWWADVPAVKKEGVWALAQRKFQKSPTVRYRGIFINDEQPALTNWIELRANYLWPAMWGSMFGVDDEANQPIADAYGIVMGTSHTEPMARATNEWNRFGKPLGGNGQWEFDTNNKSLTEFFTVGAQRAKPYGANTLFTMAMRGSGDTALLLTEQQAIEVLQNVVTTQREVLGKVFNGTDVSDIPQMWCLYKEVQSYYEKGLDVPEDVTLLWADDNWGNIRRLPVGKELDRVGRAGIYYHVDYVGDPRNYKWINTIQLEKTTEQMHHAYERQADRIWILNVGDLKPLEIPINHFLDLAYDAEKWGQGSTSEWLKAWASRDFTPELSDRIAKVVSTYGMYAARRKYELIQWDTYSVVNYNEADAIIAQWQALAVEAQSIYDKLPVEFQPSFYEMVLQPVLGGGVVNMIHIGAGKNRIANSVADKVRDWFSEDHKLTQRYHDLFNGKWNHMLDQTHLGYDLSWHGALYDGYWQQPMRNTLPPLSYVQSLETSLAGNIGVSPEGTNASVAGDDAWHDNSGNTLKVPPMDPYGPKTRWIDIFARGTAGCQWTASPVAPYVKVTPNTGFTGGNNGTDYRVLVSIDWSKAPPAPNSTVVNINITSSCPTWGNFPAPIIQVPVNNMAAPADFRGFIESDKHISIEAAHATRNTSVNGVSYAVLSNYGRTLSGVTLSPVLAETQPVGTGPVLEYDIYTFTNTTAANVTLYLSPSHNNLGFARPLRYGIAFDAETPKIIQPTSNYTGQDYPKGWNQAVADGAWGVSGNMTTTKHDLSVKGKHTLRIWVEQPGMTVQKVVVDLGGVRASYLGPPESFLGGRDSVGMYEGTNFAGVGVEKPL